MITTANKRSSHFARECSYGPTPVPLPCLLSLPSRSRRRSSRSSPFPTSTNPSPVLFPQVVLHEYIFNTRSTATVHTSTKARLTSVAISIPIHIRIPYLDRHRNLIICSLSHCQPSLKISCKSVWKFLRKVANKQTYRQTNNDKNITSLTEVINKIGNCNNYSFHASKKVT